MSLLDTVEVSEVLASGGTVALLDSVRELVAAVGSVEAEKPQATLADAVSVLLKAIAARLN